MKKLLSMGVCLALALSYSGLAQTKSLEDKEKELFPAKVLVKGKGFEIKSTELDDSYVAYKSSLAARKQNLPERDRARIEAQLLDRMIMTKILTAKAIDADKAKGQETTDKFIANTKKQFPTDERFMQELKASGISYAEFQKRLLDQAICEQVIDRELKTNIVIAPATVKKFYDENPERFEQSEQVRVSHILLSTVDKETQQPLAADKKKEKEDQIKRIKFRAERGEDFAKLAKENSEDPGSRDKGGEYTFGKGDMVKPFEVAAFSLQTNQISDVVETQFGYHIIKLLEKFPAKKVALADVEKEISAALSDQELSKQLPVYFQKLKKDFSVEILDEKRRLMEEQVTAAEIADTTDAAAKPAKK